MRHTRLVTSTLFLLLALPAASQAATNRDLLSDANLRIDRQAASDRSGSSVSDAGM
jgi:hypothetical protein